MVSQATKAAIGVILMVVLTIILAAVIAIFVFGMAWGGANQTVYTKNITVASADYGSIFSHYYVTSTEPFTYTSGGRVYDFARRMVCRNITIKYTIIKHGDEETRRIESAEGNPDCVYGSCCCSCGCQ